MHTAHIGDKQISSWCPYIVYGHDRGLVADCHRLKDAVIAMQADAARCRSQGEHSDAAVYAWSDTHDWVCVDTHADR